MKNAIINYIKDRVFNKYSFYGVLIIAYCLTMYMFRHEFHLFLRWFLLDAMKRLITNLINNQTFLTDLSNFIFTGGIGLGAWLVHKKKD
jgi:hypothetical protein